MKDVFNVRWEVPANYGLVGLDDGANASGAEEAESGAEEGGDHAQPRERHVDADVYEEPEELMITMERQIHIGGMRSSGSTVLRKGG